MSPASVKRIQFSTEVVASQINPSDLGEAEVVHYSIPALQETGKPTIESANEIASNKWLLHGGEVLVSKLNVHKNCVTIAEDHHDLPLLASTEFVPFVAKGIERRYLKYVFQSEKTIQRLISCSESATRSHARVNPSDIIKLKVHQPEIHAQISIANYLDRETARIDRLIAAKESMLALLDEKRAALISSLVTHGLDSNATMRASGLEWLGEIPAHWEIDRAKNLFTVRDERSSDGSEELLTVSHITGVTPRSEKDVNMFEAEDKAGYKRCELGDLAINTLWAWMGAMGVSPLNGIVSPDYHVYRSKGQLLPEYIDLLCRSRPFVAEVNRWSKGVWSSRLRLYPENFFEMRLPIPPHDEQRAIVDAIETDNFRENRLRETLHQSVALARERRAALITAAVNGQISLMEMAA